MRFGGSWWFALGAGLVVGGCGGAVVPDDVRQPTDSVPDGVDTDVPPVDPADDAVGTLRRLSTWELDRVLVHQLGLEPGLALATLPPDPLTPFDNEVTWQDPSPVLLESLELLGTEAGARVSASVALRERLTGCGADADVACVVASLPTVLRRVLRRPVARDELGPWEELVLSAGETLGVRGAVHALVAVLVQHPEVVYRIETTTDDGLADGPTLASRMSFLLWGSAPDDLLLAAAEEGELATAQGRAAQARRLLEHPRAREQVRRFHAQWLGYERLTITADWEGPVRVQADALVDRVVFDDHRPWVEVLTLPFQYINAEMGPHYGLPSPAAGKDGFGWVDARAADREGLLATAAFLMASSHTLDSSPTLRGKLLLERLLCDPPDPPPSNVNADAPPASTVATCKLDRYEAHRTNPSCARCHEQMDALGEGLERYNRAGGYRWFDDDPETALPVEACPLPEGAAVPDLGAYKDVGELGALLASTGRAGDCVVEHLVAYAFGAGQGTDRPELLEALQAGFRDDPYLDDLLVSLVASSAFAEVER